MNIFERSGQSVGDNSSAIQVSGDAHFGNTTTEVMAICQLVIKNEMATLREDAYNLAKTRAEDFSNQIANRLSQDIDEKLRVKLADPDIQYTLNQAVIQVARKGFDAKSDLLKELIISKFNLIEEEEEEDNLLIDQAVEIAPRLTTSEIKAIALIYYFRYCNKLSEGINITQVISNKTDHPSNKKFTLSFCQNIYRELYQKYQLDFIKILGDIESLKPVELPMMSFKGCTWSINTYQSDYFDILKSRTGVSLQNENDFEEHFPILKSILKKLNIESLKNFNSFTLSPIGIVIAMNYLKSKNFLS